MNATQEPKYKIDEGQIVNRASGEPIPHDEPIMIFRARDCHARTAIARYMRELGHPTHHQAVAQRLQDFNRFATDHPERMHEPDTGPVPLMKQHVGSPPPPTGRPRASTSAGPSPAGRPASGPTRY